jgi:Flp pilus assembly protein TadD
MRLALALALLLASPAAAVMPDENIDPALAALRDRIDAGDAAAVLPELRALRAERPEDADVLTLMGYAARKSGDLDMARCYYDQALALSPAHPGALEYLGEMEIGLGRIDAAKALLARLERACPAGCEELDELRQALREAGH